MTKSEPQSRPVVSNQSALGVVLGVSATRVSQYLNEGMPTKSPAGFDLGKCVAWFVQQKTNAGVDERKKLAEAVDREKAAELKDIQIRQKNGELIEVGEVVRFVSQDYAQVKSKLLALGSEISPSLPANVRDAVTAEIDNKVRLTLHELANRQAEFEDQQTAEDG